MLQRKSQNEAGHELTRPLVHDLVNKLAVIVGQTGSQSAQRVSAIQNSPRDGQ
jgi:hypothetical protein